MLSKPHFLWTQTHTHTLFKPNRLQMSWIVCCVLKTDSIWTRVSEILPCVCTSGRPRTLLPEKRRETNRFYSNFHPVPPVFTTSLWAWFSADAKASEHLCVMNEAIEGSRHWFTCRPLRGQTWQRQRNVQGTVRTSCFLLRPETRSLPEHLFNQSNSLGISYEPKQSADWSSGVCERSVFDRWVSVVLAAWIISVAQNECPAGDTELSSSWDPSQQIQAHIWEESRLAQPAQCERYRETYCVH